MTATLRHRGPDDEGVWVDGPVGLGMRRLAIIDLSTRAAQPMTNEDGSLWLVFNGEIYNFQALRRELESRGHTFRSDGDAETVLHLYEMYGTDALRFLRGMFAFALWDGRARTLFVARDRLGKKPLVYYHDDDTFVFAPGPTPRRFTTSWPGVTCPTRGRPFAVSGSSPQPLPDVAGGEGDRAAVLV